MSRGKPNLASVILLIFSMAATASARAHSADHPLSPNPLNTANTHLPNSGKL